MTSGVCLALALQGSAAGLGRVQGEATGRSVCGGGGYLVGFGETHVRGGCGPVRHRFVSRLLELQRREGENVKGQRD